MIQDLQAYDILLLVVCSLYAIAIAISYTRALQLDKRGVRTNAIIHSFETEEYYFEDSGGIPETRSRQLAHIEFETKDQGRVKTKLPIGKYKSEKYREKLPIVYPKNRPEKAVIDDVLHIYQNVLSITLIGLVILLFIAGYMVFGE